MNLSGSYKIVTLTSSADPALDADALRAPCKFAGVESSLLVAYLQTRDEKHLRFKDGVKPRWFRLRPIKARELNSLVRDASEPTGEELWTIARRCLEGVEDPSGELMLGDEDFALLDAMRGTKIVTDDAMEKLANVVGLEGVREIGYAVLVRARPAAVAAPFALPPG